MSKLEHIIFTTPTCTALCCEANRKFSRIREVPGSMIDLRGETINQDQSVKQGNSRLDQFDRCCSVSTEEVTY